MLAHTFFHQVHHALLRSKVPRLPAYWKRLAKSILPAARGSLEVTTNYGVRIKVDPTFDKGLEREIYYLGNYETGTLHIFRSVLRPGDTMIDVGANIGLMSLTGASVVGAGGRVFSIEPNPGTFEILQENVRLNGFTQVVPKQIGLGSKPGKLTLFLNETISRGSASLVAEEQGARRVEIEVTTLDQFVQAHQIEKVRLLKIDVEGYETEVLRGAAKLFAGQPSCMLCFEFDGRKADQLQIATFEEILKNWQFFRLKKGKSRIAGLLPLRSLRDVTHADNIFAVHAEMLRQFPRTIFS